MSILSFISGIFAPAAELIDNLHTSDEERLKMKAELQRITNEITTKQIELEGKRLDLESKLNESRASIITAEAKGESWLQRSWRPITCLSFVVLIICHQLGITEIAIHDKMWDLLTIAMSGYIVSRGAEKGIKEWKKK